MSPLAPYVLRRLAQTIPVAEFIPVVASCAAAFEVAYVQYPGRAVLGADRPGDGPLVPNSNGSRYSNPALGAIIATTQTATDPAERAKAFADWQRIAQEDLPVFPLFELQRITVVSRQVRGLPATPDQAFSSLKSVWLDGGA